MTKQTITILLVFLGIGLLTAVGCKPMFGPKSKDDNKTPAVKPTGQAPSERTNFPGGCLVVKLDGKQTHEAQKENNEQIWSGGEISAAPTLMFTMDQSALGDFKGVSLVIHPIQGGKVIQGNIYQYAGNEKLAPGKAISLNSFMHVKDNKLETGIKALPAGTYRISLQVHGLKHWDRQGIDVTVK